MAEEAGQLAVEAVAPELVDEETPLLHSQSTNNKTDDNNHKDDGGDRTEGRRLAIILCALWIGVFLSALDQTLITTLLTPISSTFNSFDNISWIATGYLIATAALQPLFGRLTDIFGRKNGLLVCNVLFGLGTLWCGIARSVWGMVLGRVVAGLGGGGLTTIAVVTVSDIVPLRDRGVIQGISNIIFGVGSGLGGLFGGVMNDTLNWRWAFLAQLPLILLSARMVSKFLNLPPPPAVDPSLFPDQLPKSSFERVDYAGSLTLVTTLVLLLLALNLGGSTVPWSHPILVASLVLSGLALCGFVYVEGYVAKEPIIPLGLLRNRSVVAGCLQNWFMVMVVYSILFYLPIFHLLTSHTTTHSGLLLSPFSIGISIGSLSSGIIMKRTGRYKHISFVVASSLVISSCIFFSTYYPPLSPSSSPATSSPFSPPPILFQIINLSLFGFGYGGCLTVNLLALISAVPHAQQAVVTSASYLFRATGGTIGVAISSAVFQNILLAQLYTRLGNGPEAVEVIKRVTRDFEEIGRLEGDWKGEVVMSFGRALGGVWVLVGGFSFAAFVAGAGVRENRLHSRLDRQ